MSLLLLGFPAFAGSIAGPHKPDPLLDGGPPGPCAKLAAGTDYAAGTDALGNPVAPADVGAAKLAVPGQIMVPVGAAQGTGRQGVDPATGTGAYVSLDGKTLAPLLNPPACQAPG